MIAMIFFVEVEVLAKFKGEPNFIQAVCADYEKNFIMMEYMKDGDLSMLSNEHARELKEELPFMSAQIIAAVLALHWEDLLHLDIKPENFVRDGSSLKLIDFGLVSRMKTAIPFTGTPRTMAPEVLDRKGSAVITAAADWWSVGVTLFYLHSILLCSEHPVFGHYPYRVYNDVIEWRSDVPDCIPDKVTDLLFGKVSFFSSIISRRDFSQLQRFKLVKNHPYFADIDW